MAFKVLQQNANWHSKLELGSFQIKKNKNILSCLCKLFDIQNPYLTEISNHGRGHQIQLGITLFITSEIALSGLTYVCCAKAFKSHPRHSWKCLLLLGRFTKPKKPLKLNKIYHYKTAGNLISSFWESNYS